MKKFTLFLCGLALVFALAGGANATSFTISNYSIALNNTDPGLVLQSSNVLSKPYSFDLNIGQSLTVDLFKIWTNETDVEWGEDTVKKDISVGLLFSSPPPPFGSSITGDTWGDRLLLGLVQYGKVEWDGPSAISFGVYEDGILMAELSDEIFNKGLFGLDPSYCDGATVKLKLKYVTAASVPEPAMMIFLGSGLVGLLAANRKRLLK